MTTLTTLFVVGPEEYVEFNESMGSKAFLEHVWDQRTTPLKADGESSLPSAPKYKADDRSVVSRNIRVGHSSPYGRRTHLTGPAPSDRVPHDSSNQRKGQQIQADGSLDKLGGPQEAQSASAQCPTQPRGVCQAWGRRRVRSQTRAGQLARDRQSKSSSTEKGQQKGREGGQTNERRLVWGRRGGPGGRIG